MGYRKRRTDCTDPGKVQEFMPDPGRRVVAVGDRRLLRQYAPALEKRGFDVVSEGRGDLIAGFGLSVEELGDLRRSAIGRHASVLLVKEGESWPDGADVVVRLPASAEFVAAQVEALHRRIAAERSVSPLTGLPGGKSTTLEMEARFDEGSVFYAAYIDVNNFKPFNDTYGFDKGDRVITALAEALVESLTRLDSAESFCGHIGGDDFVAITSREPSPAMNWLTSEFDNMIRLFYSETDVSRQGIVSFDREGRRKRFPLMSLSVVSLRCGGKVRTAAELSRSLAGIKRRAKCEAMSAECSVYLSCHEGEKPVDSDHLLACLIRDESISTLFRRAAMEAAGEIRIKEAADSLERVLRESSDEKLRKSAAYSLGRIANRESIDGLTTALTDSSAHVRMRAAEALGEIGESRAFSALRRAASDPNSYVRSAAVRSLGRLGVRSALGLLIDALHDPSSNVKISAIGALGMLGGDGVYEPLARCLTRARNGLRRAIAEALGRVSDPRAVRTLCGMLNHRDGGLAWRAAYSLYLLARDGSDAAREEEVSTSLVQTLDKKDGRLLRAAALALGAIGAQGTARCVNPLLSDTRDYVRSAAAWALGRIGEACASRPLRRALKDGKAIVRSKAAWALGELGMESSVEPLRLCLKDRSEQVRKMAAMAICSLLEKLVGVKV